MRWRRMIVAVGAGSATSALATLACEESGLFSLAGSTWHWYLQSVPAGVTSDAWWAGYQLFIGAAIGLPGVVVALAVAATGRKPRPGHCRACGYDLTGNISGKCPECGEAT